MESHYLYMFIYNIFALSKFTLSCNFTSIYIYMPNSRYYRDMADMAISVLKTKHSLIYLYNNSPEGHLLISRRSNAYGEIQLMEDGRTPVTTHHSTQAQGWSACGSAALSPAWNKTWWPRGLISRFRDSSPCCSAIVLQKVGKKRKSSMNKWLSGWVQGWPAEPGR